MTKSCQKLFISALIILQFLAPLVHAHASSHNGHFGLHLPGLEFALKHEHAYLTQAGLPLPLEEGVLVAVSSGIKQNPVSVFFQQQDQDSGYLASLSAPTVKFNNSDGGFYIHIASLSPFVTNSARAPPQI